MTSKDFSTKSEDQETSYFLNDGEYGDIPTSFDLLPYQLVVTSLRA